MFLIAPSDKHQRFCLPIASVNFGMLSLYCKGLEQSPFQRSYQWAVWYGNLNCWGREVPFILRNQQRNTSLPHYRLNPFRCQSVKHEHSKAYGSFPACAHSPHFQVPTSPSYKQKLRMSRTLGFNVVPSKQVNFHTRWLKARHLYASSTGFFRTQWERAILSCIAQSTSIAVDGGAPTRGQRGTAGVSFPLSSY